jgi:hypothetical protein
MGFLDWFRRKKPPAPRPRICYDIAYRILPHYCFQDFEKLDELCRNVPTGSGPFFYLMAAEMRQLEPVHDDAKLLRWHLGELSPGVPFYVLEYPEAPPIDFTGQSMEAYFQQVEGGLVLSPYFSAIVCTPSERHYFVLGQAPMGGGTTFRCVTAEGMNCNLGPGPLPELEAFLTRIRQHLASKERPSS